MSRRVTPRPTAALALAACGGGLARLTLALLDRPVQPGMLDRPVQPGMLDRPVQPGRVAVNYHGRLVGLAGGPALVVAASLSASAGAAVHGQRRLAVAALLAGLASGAIGRYDDVAGHSARGLGGHVAALRRGQISSGVVKLVGLSVTGATAAAMLPELAARHRWLDRALGAGVIAGTANLVNLLDLRPGRALKAGLLLAAPLALASGRSSVVRSMLAGPVGAGAVLLPDDLAERVMLGDAGANGLGALLGLALAASHGRAGRAVVLGALVVATLASERISFSDVIDSVPVLRRLDRLGRSR